MTDRSSAVAVRPIWMKQAEEAKQKNEAEKAAAAKAAFEATFKAVDKTAEKPPADDSSDSDAEDESEDIKNKPVGPVDPSKCTAAGAGIAGGTACAPSSFVITTKDSDGRKILTGGAQMKVRISPGVGVGGPDQDGMLKDLGDGTYTVTYAVPKRGNYMVHVECNGRPIMGSPFPVFFSAGTPGAGLLGTPTQSPFPNLVNQTMPNMPNYAGSVSGAFPGLLGMIPGVLNGASGGAILPGVGASLGEVCREYLNGRCSKSDCKFNHPPHNLLMTALAATTTMGTLSQVPMAPSAAAMAAAQAIVAAQALQAHAAQVQAQAQTAVDSGSPDKAGKADALKKTLQVSNLSPLLTADQLKQLFSYCGTVVECSITDSKHFGYIEYSKPEEATAALALNNMDVGGRPLNVEMAKSLPSKTAIGNPMHQSSLPMVMQQAVAMQQMQFQQALMMQQTMASQQAASRAATMKSATEMASARAAEISKKLKADGVGNEDKEGAQKSRSPSTSRPRSKSRSRSPIKYRRSRRSRSFSPPVRYPRDRRSRSPFRSRHHKNHVNERRPYRDVRDSYSRGGRRNWDRERELEQERSRDHYSSVSRRHRSRSMSPRTRRSSWAGSASPKRHRESVSPRMRKSSRAASKSPRHHRESRSSPRRNHEPTSHRSRRSRSKSAEGRRRSDDAKDMGKSGKPKQDHGKLAKSRDDVAEPDLFVKDPEDSMEGRTTDSPTPTHKESSLFPEDRALKDEKDVSKSAEGRHYSDDVKDTKKSGRSKPDHRELNKSRDVEEPDLVAKDPEDLREDGATDLPTPTHKKSPLLPEDRAFKDEKDASKHETCGFDDGNSAKTEAAIKNEDLLENSSMDLLEDKRSASPPISKSRKESSASAGDRPRTGSDDLGRRNKSSREYRKRERIDSIREQDSLADDLSRRDKLSPEYRKRERTDSVREQDSLVDGLARRDKLSPEYRKREGADSTRERDSLVDDSKYSREDRRASDSSKSRSHRRSLKPLEDGSSRGKDDRNRREESKREYVKHDKTHTVRKERNYLDYDSSDSREDRKVSSSKRKTHVRSSPSLEDGTSRDRNRREESKREQVKHEKTRPVTKERDYLEYDSSDSREDRRVSSSKRKTRTRSSPLLEDGTSRDRRDRKDRNRHEMSRRETRKSARTDHSTKMEDFNDGNLEGSRQDEKVPYSSKLTTQKRDSMSEDDVTSMDVKDLSGCEVADRKLAKTDSIIKEQDCIGQDSADLTGDRVSDFPELMVQGSSTPDGGRSRGAKGRSRHEKSMSEQGKFEKTCNVKGRDYSDDDSVDSREEDRKAAKSPISKAQKRSSMSPKDRNSMGTEDEKPRKKPKLEHESVSGFGVSLARDDDEYGFHDGSPSLHVGNYQDSAKLSSPSPSSNDHV
ncbi:uncharacterized protein LOC131239606 [Magnolia sinica]|uniref:uncharacterized protein LOC131239606 n=1 Tax=Magnolia sinica TaxID=86752 RepID=UPI00265AB058|nr:uncharacterized protein LOC131239606 [Magnolia sinica]